jgi:hypothetical protein
MRKYPSAVDAWLLAILVGLPVLLVCCGVFALFANGAKAGMPLLLTGVIIGVLIRLFSFPCVYTLDEDQMLIRCGIIKYDVSYSEILKVEKSGSLWSAPALSVRRVKIETTSGGFLVSPRDRDAFIADVMARMHAGADEGK